MLQLIVCKIYKVKWLSLCIIKQFFVILPNMLNNFNAYHFAYTDKFNQIKQWEKKREIMMMS